MTEIQFPWPDKHLSSNSRMAHRWATRYRQAAREEGYHLAAFHKLSFSGERPLQLRIIICPPDRRRRDDDNIVTAFKSYRDGMFKFLGLDDSLIKRTIIERGQIVDGGALYVTLKEME